ncbi:MAG: flagellar type III secretion system protein FlhB [Luteimonas sp.]|nr:flagellar type III secretion system protein FlhB [Luteimonas sp.]
MSADSDEEKSEAPTPRKLEKAREDGQVPRSRELTTFMLLCIGVGALWLLSGWIGGGMAHVMRVSMDFNAPLAFQPQRLLVHLWMLAMMTLKALAPLAIMLVLVALGAPTLLGGWLFSGKSIKLDFSKLDPIKGLGRQFGSQLFAELAKAIAKSGLILLVGGWFLYLHMEEIFGLALEEGQGALLHALRLVVACCAFMLLSFIVVVIIDVPYQLWSHYKKLRMSKDEIKKEHKETEGDPQIKGRIRQRQQAMARGRMMSKVPEADVIVTNPTHFAVALVYRDLEMRAPTMVAKGTNAVAARIRELGQAHEVPLLEAPPLARALYRHCEIDQEIPAPLYAAVAEVLAWVHQIRRHRSEGGAAPDTPAAIDVPPGWDEMTTDRTSRA